MQRIAADGEVVWRYKKAGAGPTWPEYCPLESGGIVALRLTDTVFTSTSPCRRRFLKSSAALMLAGALPLPVLASIPPFPALKTVAAQSHRLFGFAVRPDSLQSDAHYRQFVASQASIIVPENALKWMAVHPARDRYDFAEPDAIAAFAREQGIRLRGHTFCWHRALPDWVQAIADEAELEKVLRQHIATVAGRYRGQIHSWDVANEIINLADGQPGGWRNSFWYQRLGTRYMDIACEALHQADPHAVICYNDYGLESDDVSGQRKRAAVLAMLRDLQSRHIPIGALGIQSHLKAGPHPAFGPGLAAFIHDVKSLGLKVYITELDVDDSSVPMESRPMAVAALYKRYLSLVLEAGVAAILTWGVWDTPHRTAATPKAGDALATGPLLFGKDGSIKEASWAALHALRSSPDLR